MHTDRSRMIRTLGTAALGISLMAAAGCSANAGNIGMRASGDGVLKIGLLIESTAGQKFLNDSQRAAVQLALSDINDAGGPGDKDVQLLPSQGGESAAVAAQDFIDGSADVVIGPTDSSSAPAAIDLLSDASAAIISPANSAAALTDYPSDGYYFRTFPSNVLEGRALAAQIAETADGNIVILEGESAYAATVAGALRDTLAGEGMAAERKSIGEGIAVPASEAADTVVVVARNGVRPAVKQLAGSDIAGSAVFLGSGATAAYGGALADGALEGAHGILAGGLPDAEFQHRVMEMAPELEHLTFAAEAYDAVVLAALAAAAAGDDAGSSIADHLPEVAGTVHGPGATGQSPGKCSSFSQCLNLLEQDKAIDYQGQSGPVGFNQTGDITSARYSLYEYGAQNNPRYAETVQVSLPDKPRH